MSAFAQLDRALKEECQYEPQTPAPGFYTGPQWAEIWGCSLSRAFGKISGHMRANGMEMRRYQTLTLIGRRVQTPHYKLK